MSQEGLFFLIGLLLWMLSVGLMVALGSVGVILLLSFFITVLLVFFWRYLIPTFYTSRIREFCQEALDEAGPAFTCSCGYGVVLETKPGMLFGTVLYVRMYPLGYDNDGNNGNLELV